MRYSKMSNNILKSLRGKEELTLESDGSLFPKATATHAAAPPFHLSGLLSGGPEATRWAVSSFLTEAQPVPLRPKLC